MNNNKMTLFNLIKKFQFIVGIIIFVFITAIIGCNPDDNYVSSDEASSDTSSDVHFVSVGEKGVIWVSSDGVSWTETIRFTQDTFSNVVYGKDKFIITSNEVNGIMWWSNSGKEGSWDYSAPAGVSGANGKTIYGMAYGSNLFVGVGTANGSYAYALWSNTALAGSWQTNQPIIRPFWSSVVPQQDVAYGDGLFVSVGRFSSFTYKSDMMPLFYSGSIACAAANAPNPCRDCGTSNFNRMDHYGIAYNNGRFVVVGEYNLSYTGLPVIKYFDRSSVTCTLPTRCTPECWSWTVRHTSPTAKLRRVTHGDYDGGRWVTVGLNGVVMWSSDNAITWNETSAGTSDLNDIVYGNGRFVAVGDKTIWYSDDGGENWVDTTPSELVVALKGVAYKP